MAESEPMQAGVVNVLLTIDPVASHAAGTYLTWDGVPFDDEQTTRCDAATPHELWAWTVTADEAPGASAVFRETVLPQIFRETVLPGLAGPDRDEALEILGRLEPASAQASDSTA